MRQKRRFPGLGISLRIRLDGHWRFHRLFRLRRCLGRLRRVRLTRFGFGRAYRLAGLYRLLPVNCLARKPSARRCGSSRHFLL